MYYWFMYDLWSCSLRKLLYTKVIIIHETGKVYPKGEIHSIKKCSSDEEYNKRNPTPYQHRHSNVRDKITISVHTPSHLLTIKRKKNQPQHTSTMIDIFELPLYSTIMQIPLVSSPSRTLPALRVMSTFVAQLRPTRRLIAGYTGCEEDFQSRQIVSCGKEGKKPNFHALGRSMKRLNQAPGRPPRGI